MNISKKLITEAIYESEVDGWNDSAEELVRDNYTGRGMYSETCSGIVASGPGMLTLILIELATMGAKDEARHLAEVVTSDSMGYNTIYYFPGVHFTDE